MHYFPAAVVNYYYEKISYMETDDMGIVKSEFSGQYSYSVKPVSQYLHGSLAALVRHELLPINNEIAFFQCNPKHFR